MTDPAHKYSDEQIAAFQREVASLFEDAAVDAQNTLDAYLSKFTTQDAEKQAQVAEGELSKEEWLSWRRRKITTGKSYEAIKEQAAWFMTNASTVAMNILNGKLPEVYAENYNYGMFSAETLSGADTTFTLLDGHTVQNMLKDSKSAVALPEPKVPIEQNLQWNKRIIGNHVLAGIVTGESIPKIAKRVAQEVGNTNYKSAVRVARTTVTAAQNAGRISSYKDAVEQGIEGKKEWLAAHDEKTRASHRLLDGEQVDVEEDFANGCAYPGDPSAPYGEIANCRCTLVFAVDGIDMDDMNDMSEKEYEAWRSRKQEEDEASDADKVAKANFRKEIEELKRKIEGYDKRLSEYVANLDVVPIGDSDVDLREVVDDPSYLYKLKNELSRQKNKLEFPQYFGEEPEDIRYAISQYEGYIKAFREARHIRAEKNKLDKVLSMYEQQLNYINLDPYSKERKSAAFVATSSQQADAVLRTTSGMAWRNATQSQKEAIVGYTGSYRGINQPLRGYVYRRDVIGTGKFVGVGKVNLDEGGRGSDINDMTSMIDRCELPLDMKFSRGTDRAGMGQHYGVPQELFDNVDEEGLKKALIGKEVVEYGFMSTSATSNSVYSDKSVQSTIYAPRGSKGIYAEPFSLYGEGDAIEWDGVSGQVYFGDETEFIFQQGTRKKVTNVRVEYGKIVIEEVVIGTEEPQLWKH